MDADCPGCILLDQGVRFLKCGLLGDPGWAESPVRLDYAEDWIDGVSGKRVVCRCFFGKCAYYSIEGTGSQDAVCWFRITNNLV